MMMMHARIGYAHRVGYASLGYLEYGNINQMQAIVIIIIIRPLLLLLLLLLQYHESVMIMNDRLCSHVAQLIKHEKQLRSVSSLCLSLTDSLHTTLREHAHIWRFWAWFCMQMSFPVHARPIYDDWYSATQEQLGEQIGWLGTIGESEIRILGFFLRNLFKKKLRNILVNEAHCPSSTSPTLLP